MYLFNQANQSGRANELFAFERRETKKGHEYYATVVRPGLEELYTKGVPARRSGNEPEAPAPNAPENDWDNYYRRLELWSN